MLIAAKRYFLLGLVTAIAVCVLDRLSKALLIKALASSGHHLIALAPFFNLIMVWNTGISFGMFSGPNTLPVQALVLTGMSLLVLIILLIWLYKSASGLVACALGLVIGGALGNVVDRLYYGAVADFFDFHINIYHWPAFNIADSAICIGVALLCWHSIFIERYHQKS